MSSHGNTAVEVQGLSRSFGEVRALAEASFTVERGELFGLLGPNGAGKTTTINILTGLARPDAGRARILGADCGARSRAIQHLIGVVPDESNLYPELTGHENLCFCGALYGLRRRERQERARALLEQVGLDDVADRRFGGYSRGMKRRLTIAAALVHRPPVLFLDEPTTGIDVESARQIRAMVAELRAKGTTVLLTTHYIEEAERLCDRVAFLVAGRVVRVDSLEGLMAPTHGSEVFVIRTEGAVRRARELLLATDAALEVSVEPPDALRVRSNGPLRAGPLVSTLEGQGVAVVEARRVRPSLEDVFVQITGVEAAKLRQERERKGGDG